MGKLGNDCHCALPTDTGERRGRDSNPRYRYMPVRRFSKPLTQNDNVSLGKDLQPTQSNAYKPAYKQIPKNTSNQTETLPPELAEIVAAWPKLPEHIKQSILALVRASVSPVER